MRETKRPKSFIDEMTHLLTAGKTTAELVNEGRWLSAIEAADMRPTDDPDEIRRGAKPSCDLGPLTELLRSDEELSPASRELLADLLERHQLVLRRGGRKVPAYRISYAEARLMTAAEDYHGPKIGKTREETIDLIAQDHDVDAQSLANLLNGKRTSARRIRKATRPQT